MIRGLFINSEKAQCSIYESGRMIYSALLSSSSYALDYLEINENNRNIPSGYDFFAFNYHPATMGWLNTKKLKKLPGLKLTFILEVAPNDPFPLCPPDDFDAYCALDPTLEYADSRVFAFPRPLESAPELEPFIEPEVPVIGSFGFATPGKGFEILIDAVNREFEKAIVKINIPKGTYADVSTWKIYKRDYGEYLSELCMKTAKPGIEVRISHDYMNKEELIRWCARNSLNCFLYNRHQPGLSATTDQAIVSGRPLAVSDNETFRHIHKYITPYPFQSLRQAMATSQPHVLQMQKDWTPENFSLKFEKVLEKYGQTLGNQETGLKPFKLRKYSFFEILFDKVKKSLQYRLRKFI